MTLDDDDACLSFDEQSLLQLGAAAAAVRIARLAESYADLATANASAARAMAEGGDRHNGAMLVGGAEAYFAVAKRLIVLAKELRVV